jgi:hypothetical protein
MLYDLWSVFWRIGFMLWTVHFGKLFELVVGEIHDHFYDT